MPHRTLASPTPGSAKAIGGTTAIFQSTEVNLGAIYDIEI
jgi:hypothetical protein